MINQKLKHKIPHKLLLIFLLLAAGLTAVGFAIYQYQYSSMKKEKGSQLQTVLDMKIVQIDHWRKGHLANANVLKNSVFLRQAVPQWLSNPGNKKVRENILSRLNDWTEFYGYTDVILTDTTGIVLMTAGEDKVLCRETMNQLARASAETKPLLTDFYMCSAHDRIHLDVIIPLTERTGRGQKFGIVILRIDPVKYLYPLLQSYPLLSKTSETLLVSPEGDNVLFLNELKFKKGSALEFKISQEQEALPSVRAATGQTGIIEGADYRGERVLAATGKIPGSSWHIVSKIDASEIYTPLKLRAWLLGLAVLFLVTVCAAVIGLYFFNQRKDFYKRLYSLESNRQALVKHYDYLTKYANDIILLSDENYNLVEVNDRAVQAYGYSREELLGTNASMVRTDELEPQFESQVEQITTQGGMIYETVHKRKNGSTFPVEVSARTIEIEGKKYLQGIIRNISERKQYELDIQERSVELGSVIQQLGASEEELKHTNEQLENNYAELASVNQELTASDEELREYLAKLSQSEEKYRKLTESAYDAIFIADAETGLIIDANQQAGKLLDMPLDQIRGMHQSRLHPPEEAERYREIFRQHLESGRAITEDLYVCRRDGARVPIDISASVIELESHRVIQGVFRDITERKRAEEQIQKQLTELLRWQSTMLDREDRVIELKKEINILLAKMGRPAKYGAG